MSQKYVLLRRMSGKGGSLSAPVRVFDDEAEARRASASLQNDFRKLLGASVMIVQGDNAVPTGLTVQEFLGSFGVESCGHEIAGVPHGQILDVPGPKIVLSS